MSLNRKIYLYGIGLSTTAQPCKIEVRVNNEILYLGEIKTLYREFVEDHPQNIDEFDELAFWDTDEKARMVKLTIKVLSGNLLYTDSATTYLDKPNDKPTVNVHAQVIDVEKKINNINWHHDTSFIFDPNYNIAINNLSISHLQPDVTEGPRGQCHILIRENNVFSCDFKIDPGVFYNRPRPMWKDILDVLENKNSKNSYIKFTDLFRDSYNLYQMLLEANKIKNYLHEGTEQVAFETFDPLKIIKFRKMTDLTRTNSFTTDLAKYNWLISNGFENLVPEVEFRDGYCVCEKARPFTLDMLKQYNLEIDDKKEIVSYAPIFNCLGDRFYENFALIGNRVVILDLETIIPEVFEKYSHILKINYTLDS